MSSIFYTLGEFDKQYLAYKIPRGKRIITPPPPLPTNTIEALEYENSHDALLNYTAGIIFYKYHRQAEAIERIRLALFQTLNEKIRRNLYRLLFNCQKDLGLLEDTIQTAEHIFHTDPTLTDHELLLIVRTSQIFYRAHWIAAQSKNVQFTHGSSSTFAPLEKVPYLVNASEGLESRQLAVD